MHWIDGHSTRYPRLLRFLGFHAVTGAAAGAVTAIALILSNVAGLRDLLAASDTIVVGAGMLVTSFALTFASASMGTAVMMLPRDTRRR